MARKTWGEKARAVLNRISNKLGKQKTLKVGFLEGATFPDGTSIPMVAALQNFGAPRVKIPPRPFFSNMVKDKSPSWPQATADLLKDNDYDATKTLNQVGAGVKGQLQQSIVDTYAPALSPVTVMLRGMRSHDQNLVVTGKTVGEARRRVAAGLTNYGASTKPLIDHGDMLNAVDFEVTVGRPGANDVSPV